MAGMIKINIKDKPRTIAGQPFSRIIDLDAKPVPMVYQCERCDHVAEIVPPQYYDDPGLLQILKTLIGSMNRSQTTWKDAENAYDFKQCVDEVTDGVLKIPESLQTWLIETVKKHGVSGILGTDAIMIKKALENTIKGEDGRGSKNSKGKGGQDDSAS